MSSQRERRGRVRGGRAIRRPQFNESPEFHGAVTKQVRPCRDLANVRVR